MMSRVTSVAQGDQIGWFIATATSARYEVVDVCLSFGAWASAALTCAAIPGKNHCPGASPAISRLWAALVHARLRRTPRLWSIESLLESVSWNGRINSKVASTWRSVGWLTARA